MRGQICDLLIFIFNSSTHHRRKRCTNVTSIDPESHMVQSQLNSQFYRNTALSTISPRKKTEAAKTICFQMFLHNTNSRACPAALDYSSLVQTSRMQSSLARSSPDCVLYLWFVERHQCSSVTGVIDGAGFINNKTKPVSLVTFSLKYYLKKLLFGNFPADVLKQLEVIFTRGVDFMALSHAFLLSSSSSFTCLPPLLNSFPSLPTCTSLLEPSSPESSAASLLSLQPILSLSCGHSRNIFKDYYSIHNPWFFFYPWALFQSLSLLLLSTFYLSLNSNLWL